MKKHLKPIVVTTAVSLLTLTQSCQSFKNPFAQEDNNQLLSQGEIIPPPKMRPRVSEVSQPIASNNQTADLNESFPTANKDSELLNPPVDVAITEPVAVVPQVEAPKVEKISYRVRKGDSLWRIARRYGVSVNELSSENGLDKAKPLAVGVSLEIPAGGRLRSEAELKKDSERRRKLAKASVKKSSTSKKPKAKKTITGEQYKVQKGDSLWLIARRANTTVKKLEKLNGLTSSRLKIGQVIILKGSTSPKKSSYVAEVEVKKPVAPVVTIEEPIDEPVVTPIVDNNTDLPSEENTSEVDLNNESSEVLKDSAVAEVEKVVEEDYETISHLVTKDDTLEDLAANYASTVELIKKYNPGISGNSDLKVEEFLKIPLMIK